ncbi:class C sortase [Bifidobacterium adolescentis]|uniref:class C sortase n=1 Tax=Bifidobacterium adolescentis TaxID=1680 RepID=UPI003A4D811D
MAVFPHGSARGGSRSDGPQQIKDLRADDFYGDSHDGNNGSRGSHDTTRNTRTYTLPTFAEATDASEAMRERRADRNKSIAMRVLAAVLILTALGIGMFPRVLQYRSARELASTSARSEKRVAGWPYPQADEAFAAAREYNKRLAKSGQPVIGEAKDPLAELYDDPQNAANNASADGSDNSGDSASAKDKEYQSLLDSGDGVMGAIRIPKISVNLPVYHGTSELTLASGAGHLYGSSLPVGGKSTHSVITGHRGLVEAAMFTRLDEMRVGDYFYLDVMGRTLGYKVDRITEINPDDTSKLKIVPGEDRVTLMTCTPYGVNTHRLLVSALRSAIPGEIPAEADATKDARAIGACIGGGILLSGALVVWLCHNPWRVRRHAAWWPKRG